MSINRPWLRLLGLGLAFRLAYLIFAPQRIPHSDDRFYWETAQALAHGVGYVYQGKPATGWMPGFSLLLSAWVWLFGAHLWVMRLLLALLSAASLPLVWSNARRWFDDRIAWWATLVFALFPPMWFYATAILSETPAIFVLLCALEIAGRLRERFTWPRAGGLGFCYAALLYLKPEFSFLGPLYLAIAILRPAILPRRAALTMCLVGALAVSPWTLRNYRLYGEFIPLKSTGGITLWWTSYHPPILEVEDPRNVADSPHLIVDGKPGETSKRYSREAIARILADPLPYLTECLTVRARLLFIGSQSEATSTGLSRAFSDLVAARAWLLVALKIALFCTQSALSLLGLAGLIFLGDPERRRALPRLHALANIAIYVALIGVTRYSMVLFPILIPHAVAAARALTARYRVP